MQIRLGGKISSSLYLIRWKRGLVCGGRWSNRLWKTSAWRNKPRRQRRVLLRDFLRANYLPNLVGKPLQQKHHLPRLWVESQENKEFIKSLFSCNLLSVKVLIYSMTLKLCLYASNLFTKELQVIIHGVHNNIFKK